MKFTVRTATVADVATMHCVRMSVRENRLSNPQRISESQYINHIAAGSAWVAETNGIIAGFAVIDAPAMSVWALFIDPDAEGAGIGRALHLRMVEWAQKQGIERLRLCTDEGARAADFYRRAGWTQTGITDDDQALFEMSLRS